MPGQSLHEAGRVFFFSEFEWRWLVTAVAKTAVQKTVSGNGVIMSSRYTHPTRPAAADAAGMTDVMLKNPPARPGFFERRFLLFSS